MSDVQQFRLPDVGEGLTEAEIVSWKVKPGDAVKVNDVIVEIETAKSLVELPCPWAGTVAELLVPEGETVEVGTPIIAVTVGAKAGETGGAAATPASGASAPADATAATAAATSAHTSGEAPSGTPKEDLVPAIPTPGDEESVEPGLIGGPAPGGRTSVLVGYGPRQTEAKRRARKGAGSSAPAAAASPNAAAPTAALSSTAAPSRNAAAPAAAPSSAAAPAASAPAASAPAAAGDARVLAKPPVRKLAKDLGIDLRAIQPSGDGGIITRADVEAALSGGTGGNGGSGANGGTSASGGTRGASGANGGAGGAASFGGRGMGGNGERETRVPVKSVRKATAEAMVRSAFTAPHVTEWVTVDVTRTMKLVERLRGMREFEGVRISPLALVARALILAVQRHPEINASWDEAAQEIVLKYYVNLGIAAATPRGLVVPNIKDAEQLSLPELAAAISELARTAREGKTPPSDMQGASISITNVGVFGVDAGTPILPPGEAAILCFGQVREMPWVHKGKVRPRQVTQLALSFDHRLVDGELGSKVLADVARILEDPGMALVLG